MTTATIPGVGLNDGRTIPQLGFGVYQIPDPRTRPTGAGRAGGGLPPRRHGPDGPDERGVGDGIRASGVGRGDVFVTSKLSNAAHRPDDARRAFDTTLRQLGSDYVDLFLDRLAPAHAVRR